MGSDDPVAGNEKNHGIPSTSLAYSPGSPWSANPGGNVPVGCNFASRDFSQLRPDLHLELATLEIKWLVQILRFTSKVTVQRINSCSQRLWGFFNQSMVIPFLQS
jgi:hypothetical protein